MAAPTGADTKRITLADVALRAGVRKPSVSVVLNGAKSNIHISASTRERILQAAEELGYMRNGGMASIASGRFGCVALLLSTKGQNSTLPLNLWQGIHDELAQRGVHLSMFRLPDELLTDSQVIPKILREWLADGMLIDYTHDIPEKLKSLIEKHKLPAIWINADLKWDCVRPDDYSAGVAATEQLLQLGHRRIAYVHLSRARGGPEKDHYSVMARYEGYCHVMQKAGLPARALFGQSLPKATQLQHILQLLQDPGERPTALLSYAEEAEGAIWAAHNLGLQLPRDLSLVAFSGNITSWEGLSVVAYTVPEYEIGRQACLMLQEKIAHPAVRQKTRVLPFTVREGNSVTLPPA